MCHVDEILKVMDDEQRARTRDDRPPDVGGMSLAEFGLALKSHLLAPRSEPAASVVNFVLRHSGLECGGGYRKTFSPWRQEGLNVGARPKGAEASLDEYIQEAGLEAWTFLVTWALNFVYSWPARRTRRAPWNLLEFRDGHEAVRAAIISGSLLVRQHTFHAEG